MSYAKGTYTRSNYEKVFIFFFMPTVLIGYLLYKHPQFFVDWGLISDPSVLYFFGKSPSFWYSTLYTGIITWVGMSVILSKKSLYKKGKNTSLSSYQRWKFISIVSVQFILLYLLPYYIVPFMNGIPFFGGDPVKAADLTAFVYVSKGFTSWGNMFYVFFLVPLSVYFFGKKYCSWFCACGNLSETIGITKWGAAWVKYKTPSGKTATNLEKVQLFFMFFGFAYGLVLFMDFLNIVTATTLLSAGMFFEKLVVDFMFGAIIGIGAYPFFGTRVWCRFGCPLAKMMELIGRYGKSKFQVRANEACKGLNLCSQVCPMGIDVASFAHKDKVPLMGSFGLEQTVCVGCGGCIDICPVDALSFDKITK